MVEELLLDSRKRPPSPWEDIGKNEEISDDGTNTLRELFKALPENLETDNQDML